MISLSASRDELERFLENPKPGECLGVDCEFEIRRTRRHIPSTLQFTRGDQTLVYDVHCGEPTDYTSALAGYKLILFASDQDLQVLQELGFLATVAENDIIDLQIGDALLNYGFGRGLAVVLEELLQCTFDTSEQKSHKWLERPLTEKQVEYAATGSQHLLALYAFMQEKLDASGKQQWLESQSQQLVSSTLCRNEQTDTPTRGQILREWVFQIASHRDIPPAWVIQRSRFAEIITNPSLVASELRRSRRPIATQGEVKRITALLHSSPITPSFSPGPKNLYKSVQKFANRRSAELNIHPLVAGSRQLSSRIARALHESRLSEYTANLPEWQREQFWPGVEEVHSAAKKK